MEQEINPQGVIDSLQAENERLRERLAAIHVQQWHPIEALAIWWAGLDAQDRIYVLSGACLILVTLITLLNFFVRR